MQLPEVHKAYSCQFAHKFIRQEDTRRNCDHCRVDFPLWCVSIFSNQFLNTTQNPEVDIIYRYTYWHSEGAKKCTPNFDVNSKSFPCNDVLQILFRVPKYSLVSPLFVSFQWKLVFLKYLTNPKKFTFYPTALGILVFLYRLFFFFSFALSNCEKIWKILDNNLVRKVKCVISGCS